MRKSFFLVFIYVLVAWFVGVFVFGPAGVSDNIYQEKEIVRLTELVLNSRSEIEAMTREYGRLLEMKTPTQSFLVEQGRKTGDVVVFAENSREKNASHTIALAIEERIFLYTGVVMLMVLLTGTIGITYISNNRNTREHSEENKDDSI